MDFSSLAESDAAIEQMRTTKLILVDKQIHHIIEQKYGRVTLNIFCKIILLKLRNYFQLGFSYPAFKLHTADNFENIMTYFLMEIEVDIR